MHAHCPNFHIGYRFCLLRRLIRFPMGVGLSRASPWRAAGLRFEDLIVAVEGRAVAHPQVVLDAIRTAASDGGEIELEFLREEKRHRIEVPISDREGEVSEFTIPLLVSYESDRGKSETSVLLGLIYHEATEVAWRWRLLWLFSCTGGMADRLVEADE